MCLCHPGCLLSLRPSLPTALSLLSSPQDSALPKLSPPGTMPTPEESDLESVKMPNSESPHQHGSFLLCSALRGELRTTSSHPARLSHQAMSQRCQPRPGFPGRMEQERGEGGTGLEPGLWGPRSHNATVLRRGGAGTPVVPAWATAAHPPLPTSVKPSTQSRPAPGPGKRRAPLCPPHPESRPATW